MYVYLLTTTYLLAYPVTYLPYLPTYLPTDLSSNLGRSSLCPMLFWPEVISHGRSHAFSAMDDLDWDCWAESPDDKGLPGSHLPVGLRRLERHEYLAPQAPRGTPIDMVPMPPDAPRRFRFAMHLGQSIFELLDWIQGRPDYIEFTSYLDYSDYDSDDSDFHHVIERR